jgi:hypothetical protein
MQLQGDIKWQDLKIDYEDFLRRKLDIDISSVIMEGIVSNTDTSFIMRSTEALEKAINDLSKESEFNLRKFASKVTDAITSNHRIAIVIGFSALVLIYYAKPIIK